MRPFTGPIRIASHEVQGVSPGDYVVGDKTAGDSPTRLMVSTGLGQPDVTLSVDDLNRAKLRDQHTKPTHTRLYRTIEELFPTTTVASHALLLGAIVGCDDKASKAKFASKLASITTTLHTLKYMNNPRSEFLVVKHCGTQWARYVTSVMHAG